LRTIRAIRPDVVQCWLLQMEVAGGIAAWASGTPWVFSERSAPQAYPPGFKTWLRVKVASLSTAIISNSPAGDRYWQTRAPDRVKRYIIPNGLPLEEIGETPVATRPDADVTSVAPLVLVAGRFEYEKNIDTLVRAIRLVSQMRPVQAMFCGDGSLRARLVQLIDDEGLTDRIRVMGYVAGLWGLMKRADVLVSASVFEGSPNVVLEAMACGCPLVVSDIPAHRELLGEETAMFVDPIGPSQFADAIAAVLRDPGRAAERARRARERARRYSLSAVAQRYAEVYRAVATRGSRVSTVMS
jgi:glycosyltransferase involved in cell wall biosynthesis